MNQNEEILQFVDRLIEEKGFPDLTPEVKEEIKKDLLTRLDDFTTAKIISALSDEDVSVFEQMLNEGKSDEEFQEFVTSRIPDFTNFMSQSLMEFREVYLGLMQPVEEESSATSVDEDKDADPLVNDEDFAPPPPPPPAPVDDDTTVN